MSSSSPLSSDRPYLVLQEQEPDGTGSLVECLTVFLTASTCPVGCKMCDLHHHTLPYPTPIGAIPRQIDFAQRDAASAQWIKLYNSGNFFDPRSIPTKDYQHVIHRLQGYRRVIIENHPKFGVGKLDDFCSQLSPQLEIAVGLETVQPGWLNRLGKQMTRDDFDRYARFIRERGIDLRVFLILGTPGVSIKESFRWAMLSIRHAAKQGARHISLIPARGSNAPPSPTRPESHSQPTVQDSTVEHAGAATDSVEVFVHQTVEVSGMSSQWGGHYGSLPQFKPEDLIEFQEEALEWASGEVVVTVDPWDLDPVNKHVQRIQTLNLTQGNCAV